MVHSVMEEWNEVGRGSNGEGEVWKVEFGMRPPARKGYRGLRPGGKAE